MRSEWLLWSEDLISRLLADSSMGGRIAGLLALIEIPEAMGWPTSSVHAARMTSNAAAALHRGGLAGGSVAESVISNTDGGRRETPAVFAV